MNFKSLIVLCLAIISIAQAAELYDTVRSYVTVLNQKNFDSQVMNNRAKGISIVHFYKAEDGKSKGQAGQYEMFAKENKGMLRMGAVSCDDQTALCKKEKIDKFPTWRIYPPFPLPVVDYQEENIDFEKLKKMTGKYITSRVVEITANNYDTFINDNPGKPKVLLFSDKKGIPLIYKALSAHFDKTLLFGLVRESESGLLSKYKVKTFPQFFLIKDKDGKPQKYEGKEFNYQAIFDFINIYSETFVFREGNEEVKSAASKPWLSERIPQLTFDSANDICLKKEGALCVILTLKDESQKTQNMVDMLYNIGQSFSSKISRGVSFYFMWLDASKDTKFFEMFEISTESLPRLIVLNPGKRKRFLIHDRELTESDISDTLDKILGGDARFTNIKGNELPELASRYPTK